VIGVRSVPTSADNDQRANRTCIGRRLDLYAEVKRESENLPTPERADFASSRSRCTSAHVYTDWHFLALS